MAAKVKEAPKDLYAVFKTTQGEMVIKLFPKRAPQTVANFVGLAKGEKEWTDPRTGKKEKKPLYNGTIFHRVIPDFMIQGGDPLGMGYGGPGYQFEDEIDETLKFDKEGLLAMANSGPNTNGSQFFITTVKTPWLNGRHTIFGEVVKGQAVADAISKVKRNERDKPLEPVVLLEVLIQNSL